jgi:hypothetical protein
MCTYYSAIQLLSLLFFVVIIHNVVICDKYYFYLASVSVPHIANIVFDAFCFVNSEPLANIRPCHGSGC